MYLLDTVVISELFKANRHPGVRRWLAGASAADLYLCSVTVAEIEAGIGKERRRNNTVFADALTQWLETTLRSFGDKVLPLDVRAARKWGGLSARLGHKGWDLAIAAIALEHGLTVVTRNVSDFDPTGVPVINPFAD